MASRFSLFLAELKRRKVYRVAGLYAGIGLAISLAAAELYDVLLLPDWTPRLVIVLLFLGFPIALLLAWAYEVKPEQPGEAEPEGREAAPSAAPSPAGITEQERRKSIAVLPFLDMSPDKDQEYFCDGMAEELINALAKVKGLRVAARTSSFHFKRRTEDVREVGRQLAVRTVLEGSVRRAEDRLRVTAQLVSVEDGFHLWSESYDRELEDVFAIQDEISRSIVQTLRPTLLGKEERDLVEAPTRSLEAYDHYLLGRHCWEGRQKTRLESALRHFEKAVELDPEFALPYAGIADSYMALGMYGFIPPGEARSAARAAAVRALELDDGLSEAHASLGSFHLYYTWEWATAEKEYARAIELSPGNALVRCWYALLRTAQGRFAEAFDLLAAARDLDPLSVYVEAICGGLGVVEGETERTIRALEAVLEKEPEQLFAVYWLGLVYSVASRHDEAASMAERAVALSNRSAFWLGVLAGTYARAGRDAEARAVLGELTARTSSEHVSPLFLAWGYIALGEKDRGLDLLARAMVERDPLLYWIHQDLWLDPVRSEPRFAELASQVGSGVMKSRSAGLRPAEPASAEPTPVPAGAAPAVAHDVEPKSIAVLPFANMSDDPEAEYFSDGMTEEIINALTQLEGLRVAARTSCFAYKGKALHIAEVGAKLNVATVLEGSVRKAGSRLRITAQLVNVADGYHLWSERYDRELEDVFAIQDDIARAIADRLQVTLAGDVAEQLVRPSTENVEAYDLYLKGRFFVNQYVDAKGEDPRKGIDFFEQALALDPGYALAHAGIADAYSHLGAVGILHPKQALPKARDAALRALELDEALAETHYVLGWIVMHYDYDWGGAESHFRRAIELAPSSAEAHWRYGFYLVCVRGRFDEAVAEARRAVELEPLSVTTNTRLGQILCYAGRDEESIIQLRKAVELEPSNWWAHWCLAEAYGISSMYPEAIAEMQTAIALAGPHPWNLWNLAGIYAASGKTAEAKAIYDELLARSRREYVQPFVFAILSTALGRKDEAFEWLERAYDERDPILAVLKNYRPLDCLRDDPRFDALFKRMGL